MVEAPLKRLKYEVFSLKMWDVLKIRIKKWLDGMQISAIFIVLVFEASYPILKTTIEKLSVATYTKSSQVKKNSRNVLSLKSTLQDLEPNK